MGLFSKSEDVTRQPARLVADLDALVADPVAFRFGGQTHVIQPITTLEFYRFLNAYYDAMETVKSSESKPAEVKKAVHGVIESVCKTITRSHIDAMTQPQLHALIKLIIDVVAGRTDPEEEKKKTLAQGLS